MQEHVDEVRTSRKIGVAFPVLYRCPRTSLTSLIALGLAWLVLR